MKKRTVVRLLLGLVAVLAVLGVGIGFFLQSQAGKVTAGEAASKEGKVERGDLSVGVTETGPVSIGNVTQTFDIEIGGSGGNASGNGLAPSENSDVPSLVVEQLYVSVGKVVQEGEPILKLDEESVNEVEAYLKDAIKDAATSLQDAKIQRDVKKLQAKNEYDANVARGKIAKLEYDTSLQSLSEAVGKANKEWKEAKSRINEIADEKKELKKEKSQAKNEEEKQRLQNEIDSLEKERENLRDNLSSLASKISEAKSKQTSGKVEAKKKYEETMVSYDNAKELYDVALNGMQEDVDDAAQTLADAEELGKKFESFVGEGEVLATISGTVTALGYTVGDELNTTDAIVTYTDSSDVSVTVSVSEEDISTIAIGKPTAIAFTAYPEEGYEGTVTGIATSESDSSTVSYDVTVQVLGDVGKLYDGMTGNVSFITKEITDVLYVSNKAIRLEGTKSYVYKKQGGKREKVEVETGFSDGVHVEVKQGLAEGDVILIESQVNGS